MRCKDLVIARSFVEKQSVFSWAMLNALCYQSQRNICTISKQAEECQGGQATKRNSSDTLSSRLPIVAFIFSVDIHVVVADKENKKKLRRVEKLLIQWTSFSCRYSLSYQLNRSLHCSAKSQMTRKVQIIVKRRGKKVKFDTARKVASTNTRAAHHKNLWQISEFSHMRREGVACK